MLPYPIFEIGFFKFHMYGFMIAIGVFAALTVLEVYGRKLKVSGGFRDFMFFNTIAAILLGFGSATLFQAFYNYIEDPSVGFDLNGGMTFIGGLIGGVITFLIVYFILRPRLKGRLIQMISVVPCAILIGHAFGRVGCFFAGCCYGNPTDSCLGVLFPKLKQPVHPTQLYEAAFLFIMFAVCSYLVLKLKFKYNMCVYLGAYGVFRFLLEYVRGDSRGEFIAGITPSQFWSLAMILASVGVYFLLKHAYAKTPLEELTELYADAPEENTDDEIVEVIDSEEKEDN